MSVGKNILRIRKQSGLTIKRVSEISGIASSLISQIENDKANPSLSTLAELAEALQTPIASFFEEEPAPNKEDGIIIRRLERPLKIKSDGCSHYLLTNNEFENLSFTYIVYSSTYQPKKTLAPDERQYEFAFVVSGQIKIEIETETYLLYPGDSIFFDSKKPHRVSNMDPCQSEVLWVLVD